MKVKIFWAVALLAILSITAAVPLAQAQDQKKIDQLQKELEQLGAKSQKGTATEKEMQRMMDLTIEITMLKNPGMTYDQAIAHLQQMNSGQIATAKAQAEAEDKRAAEQRKRDDAAAEQAKKREQEQLQRQAQEKDMYPGDTRGWPSTALLQERGLASLKQPAKTNASYNSLENNAGIERILLTGANANTLQDVKQQIEKITGKQMTGSGNKFSFSPIVKSKTMGTGIVYIELIGSTLIISFGWSAG
jgi:hypothetical protein